MRGYYSSLSISDPDRSRMNGNEKASVTEHLAGIHTPLRNPRAQTRLIHFDPVESGDSILVSLETWDSESAPPYNAISYTWGELSDRHAIIINNTRVYVSENCFHALVQARLRFPSDHVWIDAICINRLNIKEESAQVALMGKIYANASLVLACAGPSDAFIRTAIELYGTAIFQDTPKWGELEQGGVWKFDMHTWSFTWHPECPTDSHLFFPWDDEDENLLTRLLGEWNELSARPYFQQARIVRELSGGKHRTMILCGQDVMEWTRVVSLGWRLHRLNLHSATSQPRSYMDVKLMMLNDQIHSDPM